MCRNVYGSVTGTKQQTTHTKNRIGVKTYTDGALMESFLLFRYFSEILCSARRRRRLITMLGIRLYTKP